MVSDLPHGWTWASFSQICEVNPKHASNIVSPDDPVTFVPMSAIDEVTGSIERPQVRKFREVRKGHTHFADGDVLFAKITPCMENGKAAIAKNLVNGIGCGTTELHILRPLGSIPPEFIFHFIRQKAFRNAARARMTGTAGQLRVPSSYIEDSMVPLAPLAEQLRIVARIREVIEKNRVANYALERIPSLIKHFRNSVLTKAFRGELTERDPNDEPAEKVLETVRQERRKRWEEALKSENKDPRQYHYKEPDTGRYGRGEYLPHGWAWAGLEQIAFVERGKFAHRPRNEPRFYGGKYPFIQTGDVSNAAGRISTFKQTLNENGFAISKLFKRGTIVVAIAANIGDSAILEIDACTTDSVVGITCVEPILSEFVEFYLRTKKSELERFAPATAQKNINLRILNPLQVPIAPIAEQVRIVKKINQLFVKTNAIEEAAKNGMKDSEELERSILVQAFQGKLLSQNPDDEPASTLLQRIRTQRAAIGKRRKSQTVLDIASQAGITSKA